MKKYVVMGLTIALLACHVASGHAAIYVQIPGMQGEVTESNHIGWIELQSLSYGHNEGPPGSQVKVQYGRVNMTKLMDGLSASLALLGVTLQTVPQLKVEITRPSAAENPVVFKMKLTGARVTAFTSSAQGSQAGTHIPVESIGWSFDSMTWITFKRNPQNQLVPGSSACWDAKNSVCPVSY
jgi:type VI protein secretion system component Hcp